MTPTGMPVQLEICELKNDYESDDEAVFERLRYVQEFTHFLRTESGGKGEKDLFANESYDLPEISSDCHYTWRRREDFLHELPKRTTKCWECGSERIMRCKTADRLHQ
jgi:hypothetical protein